MIKIPNNRIKDIIASGIRARNFSNEECFLQGLELIDFAVDVIKNRKNESGKINHDK